MQQWKGSVFEKEGRQDMDFKLPLIKELKQVTYTEDTKSFLNINANKFTKQKYSTLM